VVLRTEIYSANYVTSFVALTIGMPTTYGWRSHGVANGGSRVGHKG